MAWTAPMTFADGVALTAAQLNAQIRDNLQSTMLAKATASGAMFWGSDINELVERLCASDRVKPLETTQSTTYTDLATVGPTVTVETGTTALVFLACQVGNNTTSAYASMSYEVSGASTIAASATWGIALDGISAATSSNYWGTSRANVVDTLTPGLNTFKGVYKVGSAANTGIFGSRFLGVWPLT